MAGNSIGHSRPGPIVLFGSGETSPSGRKVFDQVLHRLYQPPNIALLETPAGFELNSDKVIGRVMDFLTDRLKITIHRYSRSRRASAAHRSARIILKF